MPEIYVEGSLVESDGQIIAVPELLPTATAPDALLARTGSNLIVNGDFNGSTLSPWKIWGQPSGTSSVLAQIQTEAGGNRYLEFRKVSGASSAVIFQETNVNIVVNTPNEVRLDMGNPSSEVKRITLIAHNLNDIEKDILACSFWLPANSARATFVMKGVNRHRQWNNLTLSIYDSSAGSASPGIQIDNVSITTGIPSANYLDITDCSEPRTPAVVTGNDSSNLIRNGEFDIDGNSTYWTVFPYPTASQGTFQVVNGGATLAQYTGSPSIALEQTMLSGVVPAHVPVELRVQLSGNIGAQGKRVTLILRDQSWGNEGHQFCTFWINVNGDLPSTLYMSAYLPKAWTNLSLSIYDSTPFDNPGNLNIGIRIDNVALWTRPSMSGYMASSVVPDVSCRNFRMRDYGIINGIVGGSGADRSGVLASVTMIGEAFRLQAGISHASNHDPRSVFQRVMRIDSRGEILVRRASRVNCIAENSTTPRIIECGVPVMTEYILTHEFGHLFNNQADQNGNMSLMEYVDTTRTSTTALLDGVNQIVMGPILACPLGNNWLRGERGWGSGPGSTYGSNPNLCAPQAKNFTDFQQNPAPYATPNAPGSESSDETAADMFLNWVYRRIGRQAGVVSPEIEGFLNRSWSVPSGCHVQSAGCPDSTNPGDARMTWMNTVMGQIFNAHGWNN